MILSLPFLVVFVATLGILWWFTRGDNESKGFKRIPGPPALPVFGNVLQVGSKMHLKFVEWTKQYGDFFQIRLGVQRAIVVSDPKLVKEIFTVDPAFAGRSFFEGFEMYPNEKLGIVSTEGELWEVHRRFLLRQLRDFGFGKSSMEQLVLDEVKETIAQFKKNSNGKVSNMKEIFQIAVINSLWTIVASKRFPHDDPKLNKMIEEGHKFTDKIMRRAFILFMPWTRYFFSIGMDVHKIITTNRQLFEGIVNEHKETYKEENIRDFIDVYLSEMNAQKDNPSSMFYGNRAERQLHTILSDLFFGTDTTSSTISWSVLYLCKFKHVQEKLQSEITAVTGDDRMVTTNDRQNMPYTMALMEEILRYSSIVPSGVQHRAMTGREFNGYFIPKDTWIFPNLYHIHHNPKIWGDPEKFRPERFLSTDGKTFKKNENVMAFQIGRRQCVGETLARDTFFLYLTNLFQRFTFSFDPSLPEPSFEPRVSFVLTPEPYTIHLKDRNLNVN